MLQKAKFILCIVKKKLIKKNTDTVLLIEMCLISDISSIDFRDVAFTKFTLPTHISTVMKFASLIDRVLCNCRVHDTSFCTSLNCTTPSQSQISISTKTRWMP